jgi:hypothetical protein
MHKHSDKCTICKILGKKAKKDDNIFEVTLPFVYKDNAIFLKDKKIADVKEDADGTCNIVPLKQYSLEGADWVIDYYADKKKSNLKENQKDEFKAPVKVKNILAYLDEIEFEVYFSDIDIIDLISKKELQEIEEKISESFEN